MVLEREKRWNSPAAEEDVKEVLIGREKGSLTFKTTLYYTDVKLNFINVRC